TLVDIEWLIKNVLILDHMIAHGRAKEGSVFLASAQIHGQFSAQGMKVSNESGLLITLAGAHVSGSVHLPATTVCPEPDWVGRGSCPNQERQISLNRFTFGDLGVGKWRDWLHLIRNNTLTYRPQPYQQLAGAERAAGHDNNVRQIL